MEGHIQTRGFVASRETIERIKRFVQGKNLEIRVVLETIDHTKIAALDAEGKIRVWDAETGDLIATVSGTYTDPENVPSLQFAETGNALYVIDKEYRKTIYFAPDAAEVKVRRNP